MTSIYTLSHPQTGEVRYVGLTRHPEHRIRQYRHKGHTPHLHHWLKSLPSDPCFSVVAQVPEEFGSQAECFWIACFRLAKCRLLNFTDGGEGSFRMSLESRMKIAEAARRQKGHRKHSEETKRRMSLSRRGRPASPKNIERFVQLNKSRTGIPLSDDHKANLRAAHQLRKQTITITSTPNPS